MKIRFIGFSVTGYGDPPYPTRFGEMLQKIHPDATVDYVAMGGLSIDSLQFLINEGISINGYDLVVFEIATSWWSLIHEHDFENTRKRVANLFEKMDCSGIPYCFLNLYRRDIDDQDVVVRSIYLEAGEKIPCINLKRRYRINYSSQGVDDTTDGIHPTPAMVETISKELINFLLEDPYFQKNRNWNNWTRSVTRKTMSCALQIAIGHPSVELKKYSFSNGHGLTLEGLIIEQGQTVELSFSENIKITGIFFTYGPDTNYSLIEYDGLSLAVPMHDSMSFYRRFGYRELANRITRSITLKHPNDDRQETMQRKPWELTVGLRIFFFGFSYENIIK